MQPQVLPYRAGIVILLLFKLLPSFFAVPNRQMLKTFLEPCDIIYSQVHCEEEEYETNEEDCGPIKTDDCNRSLQLYCISGVCLPNCHPSKENYDHIEGKCFRKIGSDCKNTTECDKNASCERKQCRCTKNFTLEPETGKCVRTAEYGETCNLEINCDKLSDIVCRNSTCQCKSPEIQFYHSKRKRCYVRIGKNCAGGLQFCPDNSNCIREFERNKTTTSPFEEEEEEFEEEPYIGILEDDTKVFKCKCGKGYAATEDGKSCLGLYGISCNSFHKCNIEKSLKCYNGICQCSRPKDQVFNAKGQKCLTLIESKCEVKDNCVDGADCRDDPVDTSISKCHCTSGLMPSLDLEVCLKDHGQNCSNSEIIDLCNMFIGLQCSNYTETCQCKDVNQFYDMKLKTCRDFEIAQRQIPIVHFDTSDREYTFYEASSFSSPPPNRNDGSFIMKLFIVMIQTIIINKI